MTVCCVIKARLSFTAALVLCSLSGQSAAQEQVPSAQTAQQASDLPAMERPDALEPILPQAPKRQAGQRLPFAPPPKSAEAPALAEGSDFRNVDRPSDIGALEADLMDPAGAALPAFNAAPKTSASLMDIGPLRRQLLEARAVADQTPAETAAVGMSLAAPQAPLDGVSEADADAQTSMVQPRVIQAQQLSSQDVASLGILTQEQSGFSTRIWRKSRASNILAAWPLVPADAPSPVMHATVKALALSVAAAPPVSDARAWALVAARLEALLRIGALEEAALLSARIPSDFAPSSILKMKAEIALWSHQWMAACEVSRIGLDAQPSQYWTGITLACKAVRGNRAAVDLLLDVAAPGERPTRDLMRAVNALLDASDPIIAAQGRQPEAYVVPEERLDDPLMHAIAVQLGQINPRDQSFIDAPAYAHASRAQAPGALLSERWPGVSALAYGARISGADLVQFVSAAPPRTPASPALGVAPSDLLRPLSARNPARRVDGLLTMSQRGIASGIGQFWGPAIGHALSTIAPQQTLWPDAGAVAGHLALANEAEALGRWYGHIRGNSRAEDLAAAQSLINVWPYAVLLVPNSEATFTPRLAQLWLQTQDGSPGAARQAVYFYAALEALGYPLAPEFWAALGGAPAAAVGPEFDALSLAARNQEVGRGILLAFAALGPDGPKMPDPQALKAVMTALVALGQDAIARRLAAEVLFYSNVSLGNGR